MAEPSSKLAASRKRSVRTLAQESDASLGYLARAVNKGWDQFDRALVDLVYARRPKREEFTIVGFLIDVGTSFFVGGAAGTLVREGEERFLRLVCVYGWHFYYRLRRRAPDSCR